MVKSFREGHQIIFNKVCGEFSDVSEEREQTGLSNRFQLRMDTNQRTSQMMMKQDYFFIHYQKKNYVFER